MKIKPVIMAGGQGTRLWPLSRQISPKQFIKIFDNKSLIQKTLINNNSLGKPTLIILEQNEVIVTEQLRELDIEADLIIEPIAKNTAPCALVSAILAKNDGYDTVILLPADHYIDKVEQYLATIRKSLRYVTKFGICTIGIRPNFANSQYGYIKIDKLLEDGIYKTKKFIEKPNFQKAQYYLKSNKYFWNSGIFIFNVDFIIEQFKLHQKAIFNYVYEAFSCATKSAAKWYNNAIKLPLEPYLCFDSISLDYAIMENIKQMIMLEADFNWSDLGNWHSLWQFQEKDLTDNYCEGDIIKIDTTNSYISSNNKLTALIGIDNLIIVNTDDALLIGWIKLANATF
jgi:mannose-1-phosphate guanylyltransferase